MVRDVLGRAQVSAAQAAVDQERLREAVVAAHLDAGVPQTELSRMVGKHPNTIAAWCSSGR